ncbi:hypothetical protein M406DRAFT_330206 [Cryphonectria parasitica EP155]|uniref:Peroxisomal membrane protein PEX14 n=1 Tax=Cryphonectria parasitica (strain ATCC 38755 / EP155) TaxID=660469 RepID=A0A9P4Y4M4_CRYP1|nr:uncharacterized protein M406DRAFT_330206 [Cryphonectria parasitica EP155]KAF3766379.1 hypothetical protein M406DRAFT_330206 [Cryphonectria parasitica EP155]
MGGSDEDNKQATLIPSWQQAATQQTEGVVDSQVSPSTGTLEQAKRFLQDETVRDASREKKIEFLRSKGLEEADIHRLLDTASEALPQTSTTMTTTTTTTEAPPRETTSTAPPSSIGATQQSTPEIKTDHPPIVTYPEFLTKPLKPPPLITASGLLNSLGLVAGVSTLVYGATRHLVSPMVETLLEARMDFHQNANKNLTRLVEKLEQTVSEIPAAYHSVGKPAGPGVDKADDDASSSSSYDDPYELFHRDIGVQTSPLPSISPSSPDRLTHTSTHAEQTQYQADRLARLSVSVRGLATDVIQQAEEMVETKSVLDQFGSDLHALTYPPASFGVGSSYLYGAARSEPDDEIKRVKTNIRSVKGVLLSTRSFPASTR